MARNVNAGSWTRLCTWSHRAFVRPRNRTQLGRLQELEGRICPAVNVAVVGSGGTSNDTGYQAIVSQLNDDTYFDFSATLVNSSQVDTVAELNAYDVVVIGDNGFGGADSFGNASFASALRTWVEGGGAVVMTGWGNYGNTYYNGGAAQANIDAIIPVNTISGYNFGNALTVVNGSHPVTAGVSNFSVSSNDYIETPGTGTIDAGATLLATSVSGLPAVVVGNPGSGRSVYLGPIYSGAATSYNNAELRSGSADRLLEQAVYWAATGTTAVRVAVVGHGDPTYDTGFQAIVNQLNDDTYFNFSASLVTSVQVDTLAELNNYDVIVVGDSGYGLSLPFDDVNFTTALKTWVQGGGGVVMTGWGIYGAGPTSGTNPTSMANIDAIVPVAVSGSFSWNLAPTVVVTNGSHPVTSGISNFGINSYAEYPLGSPPVDSGASVLATANGTPTVVVGNVSSGRGVYLGPIYSGRTSTYNNGDLRVGAADKLFEQAVHWAANVSGTTPTSLTLTAPNATYDGAQHGGSAVVNPGAPGTLLYVYTGTGGYNSSVPPTNAGTYQVTATFTPSSSDYEPSTATTTFTISQRSISYTIGNAAHDYGSTVNLASTLGTTFATGVNGENLSIAYASSGNTTTANVGSYTITGAISSGTGLASNYVVTLAPGNLTVNAKAISYTIGNAAHDYGSTADLAATLGTTFLTGVNGENLAIAYASSGNTVTSNVGSYAINGTVSSGTGLASNYIVTLVSGHLTVNAKAVSFTIGNAAHDYGSTVNLAATLGNTFATGVNGENLSIAYASAGNTATANVGNYAITGTVSNGSGLTSNYIVTLVPGSLTVNAKAISYTIGNTAHAYGSTADLATTLGSSFATGVSGESLSIVYASAGNSPTANVGSYAITGSVSSGSGLASNYVVTLIPGNLTVSARAISWVIGSAIHEYGSTVDLAAMQGSSFATGVNGESLSIAYASAGNTPTANVGNYAITGTVSDGTGLASNYVVTVIPANMHVFPKSITYAIGNAAHDYGSTVDLAATLGTSIAGLNGETLSIAYASGGNTTTANVGSYAITGTVSDGSGLGSNYAVTLVPGNLTVNAKAISYAIDSASHDYGSTVDLAIALGTDFATGVNGETLSIAYASAGDTATAHVGSYAITGSVSDGSGLASNYIVTLVPGNLTVNAKAISYAIGNVSMEYGSLADLQDALGSAIETGVNGEYLSILYFSMGNTNTSSVGSYSIDGAVFDGSGLASDYSVTLTSGTLTVTPRLISYTIGNAAHDYGSTVDLAATLGTTIPGVNGEVLSIAYASAGNTAMANVGSYAITGSVSDGISGAAPNYIVTLVPGNLTVNAKAISYTIGNAAHDYGSTVDLAATLGASFATGVNGESLSTAYVSSGNTTTANVGSYAITSSVSDGTGLASNYIVTLVPGNLTVNAKAISYTIGNAAHDYGSTVDLAATLGTDFTTGVNGQTLSIAYASAGNTTTASVGGYSITGSVSDGTGLASNYVVTLVPGTLTVSAKAITYTIGNAAHDYGSTVDLAATLGTSIAGVNGESLSIAYASSGNTAMANVGSYAIAGTVSDGSGLASNYVVTLVPGNLTVNAKAISHTIGDTQHDYGSTVNLSAALGSSFATGLNGETLSIAYASAGNTTTANVGNYAITGAVSNGSGLASNYVVTLVPGNLTINAKAISYTIGNAAHDYGSTANLALTLGATVATGVNGENLSIGYSSAGNTTTANVGNYAITGAVSNGTGLASNYIVTLTPGILTVNAKAISYVIGNAAHTYGSTVNLAATLGTNIATGVNGENLSIAYASTGNTTTANVGSYAITGAVSNGSGLASNYVVTLVPGVLTVNQATLTGDATTQDALNMAKQGKLTITVNNLSGLQNGNSVAAFLSTATYYITVGTNSYEFVPTSVTASGSGFVVTYTMKDSALAAQLAAELADNTSASTAAIAGFSVESTNYRFKDEYLTRMFSTVK